MRFYKVKRVWSLVSLVAKTSGRVFVSIGTRVPETLYCFYSRFSKLSLLVEGTQFSVQILDMLQSRCRLFLGLGSALLDRLLDLSSHAIFPCSFGRFELALQVGHSFLQDSFFPIQNFSAVPCVPLAIHQRSLGQWRLGLADRLLTECSSSTFSLDSMTSWASSSLF